MIVFRCTRKLLRRLKIDPAPVPPPSTTAMGDWYADVFTIRRKPHVLFMNEPTMLCAILPLRESATLFDRFRQSVSVQLLDLGAPPAWLAAESKAMEEWTVAKTANRAVVGTMKQWMFEAGFYFDRDPNISLRKLEEGFNDTPCGAMKYAVPIEKARERIGLPPRPTRRLLENP